MVTFGIGLTQLSTVSFLGGIFGGFDGQAWLNLVKYTIISTIHNKTAISKCIYNLHTFTMIYWNKPLWISNIGLCPKWCMHIFCLLESAKFKKHPVSISASGSGNMQDMYESISFLYIGS